MTKFLTVFPDLGDPGAKLLHPAATGEDITLTGDLVAEHIDSTDDASVSDDLLVEGGLSVGNTDGPLTGQIKLGVAAGSGYLTGYAGAYLPLHVDGSELLFDISGTEALNLLSTGHLRIRNNKLYKSLNAAGNADLDLIGRNGSDQLVLGSGLSGVLLGVSSVVSALALGSALQEMRVNSAGTALEFFSNTAGQVYHNTTQTATNGGATNWLQWNTNRTLTGITKSNGNATNSKLAVDVAGVYLITLHVSFPNDTTGNYRRIGLFANNTTNIGQTTHRVPAGAALTDVFLSRVYTFAAAGFVEAFCTHDATGNLTMPSFGNAYPELSIVRIG